MVKSIKLKLPIYEQEFYLIIFDNFEDLKKKLKRLKFHKSLQSMESDEGFKEANGIEDNEVINGIGTFYIAIRVSDADSMEQTLVHELVHLLFDMFEHTGTEYKKGGSNEHFAYNYEWLFTQTIKHVRKYKTSR